MRLIEEEMRKAIERRRNWKKSNTEVCVDGDFMFVFLYGKLIAKFETGKDTLYSLAGYNTPTTRSRLNALGCHVCCKNYTPYRDGAEWWGDF